MKELRNWKKKLLGKSIFFPNSPPLLKNGQEDETAHLQGPTAIAFPIPSVRRKEGRKKNVAGGNHWSEEIHQRILRQLRFCNSVFI
jgi:hypothetical protein